MADEGLVQYSTEGGKKPFGGFFQKRFNGFLVNILLSLQMAVGGLK
jgi:hypothetical protein